MSSVEMHPCAAHGCETPVKYSWCEKHRPHDLDHRRKPRPTNDRRAA